MLHIVQEHTHTHILKLKPTHSLTGSKHPTATRTRVLGQRLGRATEMMTHQAAARSWDRMLQKGEDSYHCG